MTTDIVGSKFKRWTVLAHEAGNRYLCRCECGTERVVRKDQLTRGVSKSCGCLKVDVARAQIVRLSTTHGRSKTRTYKIWKGIRKRCIAVQDKSYKHYGGRGISICPRWDSYENFLADMGEAPEGMSIDRIDNNGNYEPGNCRWASKKTQANNTRTNLYYRYNGELLTLKQLAAKVGIDYHALYQRLFRLSWPLSRAIKEPVIVGRNKYT